MNEAKKDVSAFFPEVNCGIVPTGHMVIVQGMTIPKKESGIILLDETTNGMKYDVQIGKIVALGPLAYKNKETLESWKEGEWASIGDIVFVPRTGYRMKKELNDEDYNFIFLSDTDIMAKIEDATGLPMFNI